MMAPRNGGPRTGTVIFTGDVARLARFYEAMAGLDVVARDGAVTVLASDRFELVLHALAGEPAGSPAVEREAYVKPFFPVTSLAEARRQVAALGGAMRPAHDEWEARGFRACEALDPDGNPVQFRQRVP